MIKLLTRDEARRIAVNIVKKPKLLQAPRPEWCRQFIAEGSQSKLLWDWEEQVADHPAAVLSTLENNQIRWAWCFWPPHHIHDMFLRRFGLLWKVRLAEWMEMVDWRLRGALGD
jgi:hypothetical protein